MYAASTATTHTLLVGDGAASLPPATSASGAGSVGGSSLTLTRSSLSVADRELAAAVTQLERAAAFRGLLLLPDAAAGGDAVVGEPPRSCSLGGVTFVPAAALQLLPQLE